MIQMSKIEQMRKALSEDALSALAVLRTDKIGTVVEFGITTSARQQGAVLAELRIHGVIGAHDGLTILGSGLAGRLQMEKLDAMF